MFVSLLLMLAALESNGQSGSLRSKQVIIISDSIRLDESIILPQSIVIWHDQTIVADSLYLFKQDNSTLLFTPVFFLQHAIGDSLLIQYRVFPEFLSRTYSNRNLDEIEKSYEGLYNPFSYAEGSKEFTLFKSSGLQSSGSLSRGITIGNNQDVVVNSSFNLQLSGNIGDDIEILAAITDNNIPLQPEGNTQQIQEFDKVFIQLSNKNNKLIAGDFELTKPSGYFMNFYKKGQGVYFEHNHQADSMAVATNTVASIAISKGKFTRFTLDVLEGNQGPYKLRGADNENFIIVLAGSEKVYADGKELKRGQDNDYTIDYNAAQITFTANFLVTREKRIVVEFQYSDKNYIRTLLYGNQSFKSKTWNAYVHLYSEQDSKNQPLLQELTDDQKLLLSQIGDSINQAFYLNADSVGYNTDEVLYARSDTIVNNITYSIFRYSTHPDSAYFRVGFTFTGANKGNYNQINSSANGRVYQWVAPQDGVPQGSYEPVSSIITPKQQSMLTAGLQKQLSQHTQIYGEASFSKYDPNLFSKLNASFHTGYAAYAGIKHSKKISKDWTVRMDAQFEFTEKRFKPIEPYRNAEFSYDWNIRQQNDTASELLSFASVTFQNKKQVINYSIRNYLRGNTYNGWMNEAGWKIQKGSLFFDSRNSYLISRATNNRSDFIRSYNNVYLKIKQIRTGIQWDSERNEQKNKNDSLNIFGHQFTHWTAYVAKEDSGKINYRSEFGQRTDYVPTTVSFQKQSVSNNALGMISIRSNPRSYLKISVRYRELRYVTDSLQNNKPEENLLGRIEYQNSWFKGAIVSNTFFEAGTGLEPKQEFQYVEVAPGSGVYTWNDYNGNGIKELDEFDIAIFSDQANYIRVLIQSNDFIRVRFNSINQLINLNPAAIWRNKNSFISRFSNQFSVRMDNKLQDEDIIAGINPLQRNINDSALLASSIQLRNTLYFNRTQSKVGADINIQQQQNKTLQSNGLETRQNELINSTLRWNLTQALGTQLFSEIGKKQNQSAFFDQRNYVIESYTLQPKILVQSGVRFRISVEYTNRNKKNTLTEFRLQSDQHIVSSELRYSVIKGGNYTMKVSYYKLTFNGDDNSALGYEILEGLKTGDNFTWSFSSQKNISKIFQLSLLYDGRKSPGVKTIHTGGVQLRAFF